jgi:hypothetical protein
MRNSRRLATMGLSVVAAGSLLAGTAAAETAGAGATASQSGGTAQANALTIKIAGQTITGSEAKALLAIGSKADAEGTQVLTPVLTSAPAHATVTEVGKTDVKKPESCNGSQLTAVPGINRFDITCAQASASLTEGGGNARALGAELVVEPSVSGALSTLQLQGPAQQATTQLREALNPLVEGLTGTPIGELVTEADQTVQDLLDDILSLTTTARIVVAPSLAEVDATGNTITSHAQAQGIRIELLPVDGAGATNNLLPDDLPAGKPLITITVGNADVRKTVTKDGSAPAKVDATAAVVTVAFGSPTLAQSLGVPSTITVQGGQSLCVPGLVGTPLETCINVASAGVDANGNPFADGVSIDLLKGLNGGIGIGTGRAVSGADNLPAAAPVAAPAAAVPAELPRTGGEATLPLIAGGLLAAALVTRRLVTGRD